MHLEIRPLSDVMAAEAVGVDLKASPDDSTLSRIREAFLEHLVLCIRGQALTPQEYLDVSRNFGEAQMQLVDQFRHETVPEVSLVSSVANKDTRGDGKPIVRGPYWHTDDSYFAVPAKATMLHAIEIPDRGGNTRFANMYAAYDALGANTKARIDGLRAVHKYHSRRGRAKVAARSAQEEAESPDVIHPLVRTHPETGRKSLYINPNRIDHLLGLSLDESDALLDELYEHAFERRFHYHHQWRVGDLVIWDNRCTMHAATADLPAKQLRLLHRILLRGTVPV